MEEAASSLASDTAFARRDQKRPLGWTQRQLIEACLKAVVQIARN
jgi:hypothetical protein